MGRPKRRTGSTHIDPDALAARLPNELRDFNMRGTPDDFRTHRARVIEWLESIVPDPGPDLVYAVQTAAGLTAARWYRLALTGGTI